MTCWWAIVCEGMKIYHTKELVTILAKNATALSEQEDLGLKACANARKKTAQMPNQLMWKNLSEIDVK